MAGLSRGGLQHNLRRLSTVHGNVAFDAEDLYIVFIARQHTDARCDIDIENMYVRPSLRYVPVFYENGLT